MTDIATQLADDITDLPATSGGSPRKLFVFKLHPNKPTSIY